MDSELYQKIFFTIVFLVLIFISFLIIKPFLTAVLTGIILSYIFYPVYSKINKKITSKNISSLVTSLLVILILTMPLFFVLNAISKEAYTTYILSKQKMVSGQFTAPCEPAEKAVCQAANYLITKANDPRIRYYLEITIKGAATNITNSISNILFSIPLILVDIVVILFIMFFLFRDGALFIDKLGRITPLKTEHRERVFKKLNDMAYAVVYGNIVIAIIQGTLGGIGFLVFGLPSPFMWGIIMIFASLIPYLGSALIWLPASLMLIFNGYLNSDNSLMTKGVLLLLYGAVIIGMIDNLLKPKIIGSKGGLHPTLVLLGAVGGLKFLGFIGVIIGPIILTMLVAFIKIYEEEKNVPAKHSNNPA